MTSITLIFPHQLVEDNSLISAGSSVILVEEHLFFSQYAFHKQKLAYHRASMKFYESYLLDKGVKAEYIESADPDSDVRKLIPALAERGIQLIKLIDPTDYLLERRIRRMATRQNITLEISDNPLFLNTRRDNEKFFKPTKKKFFQTSFYKEQRVRFGLLMDPDGQPTGGKWTYDIENRKKYPAKKIPPPVSYPKADDFWKEALDYVQSNFKDNPGNLGNEVLYPYTFEAAREWLEDFLQRRFHEFGPYEDAIVAEESILNHSVLTPMLNTGLLRPGHIIERTVSYAQDYDVPLNSTEGFVRQIIGWREFIRGVYEAVGCAERTRNFWGFDRQIPDSFYDGTTGIDPIDITIKKVLETGYCHHIERLMVLGNFMVLCEFDPDEVYRWFMELFIDSYDWVMVPNVYGMSQFADGGLMSTKPYISSSNYLMKMSDYKKGVWQKVWDGLFWRFMHVNRDFFSSNPRLSMLVRNLDRMDPNKLESHLKHAEEFLASL